MAIVREWTPDFLSQDWNAYVINNRADALTMVLVVSKGFDTERKTSILRHRIASVASKSYEKIELLPEELIPLRNEFFITFFAEGKLFEKRFVFPEDSINEKALVTLPLIGRQGILAK